jgi:hypothetical protein
MIILVWYVFLFVASLPIFLGMQRIFYLSLISLHNILGKLSSSCHCESVRLLNLTIYTLIWWLIRFIFIKFFPRVEFIDMVLLSNISFLRYLSALNFILNCYVIIEIIDHIILIYSRSDCILLMCYLCLNKWIISYRFIIIYFIVMTRYLLNCAL